MQQTLFRNASSWLTFSLAIALLTTQWACSSKREATSPPPPSPAPSVPAVTESQPVATPERRNDQTALDLIQILRKWGQVNETAYLETGLILSTAYSLRHGTDPKYYPEGVDELVRKLKKWPAFKNKEHVQKLGIGYFNPETGIRTAGDLYDFVEMNRNFSAS